MMVDHALRLAAMGFHVFPVVTDASKKPKRKGWQSAATVDPDKVRELFTNEQCNIGIFTGVRQSALLVIDVDNKNGKCGDDTLLALELAGNVVPPTYEQRTPTGGRHLVYRVREPVKQGTSVLGPGLDIRSRGGYIVGSGSVINGRAYTDNGASVVEAPVWLIEACERGGNPNRRDQGIKRAPAPVPVLDHDRAERRARAYLAHEAPKGEEGSRNDTALRVALRLRDFGLSEPRTLELMAEDWVCVPDIEHSELAHCVRSAYTYSKDTVGNAAPETQFTAVPKAEGAAPDPVLALNKNYAFVLVGGGHHILYETTDHLNRWKLEHLNQGSFYAKLAAETLTFQKGTVPITELWMKHKQRRSYEGLVFLPEQQAPDRFYNLWRGFSVEPSDAHATVVDDYLGHLHQNVCGGDDHLFAWLMSWLAHLVQRPWEKPHVAIVLRGGKGVGKNAAIEHIGALLGRHFLLASNKRYLVGNFNGHLEHCLLFALDEAFWSGDKQAEGTLKDLITGKDHVIEHKGKEPYPITNLTRVAIIGNEEWLVPASHDERRFAVFDVGTGRRQDGKFFAGIQQGLERGGYSSLLGRLLSYAPIVNVNIAPSTQGLVDQKHASLDFVGQWWLASLQEGRLMGTDFPANDWSTELSCETVRNAFRRYTQNRAKATRLPDDMTFGKLLKGVCPPVHKVRLRIADGTLVWHFRVPTLREARAAWDTYIGGVVAWGE